MKNHLKRYSRLMLLGLTTTFTLASLTGCLHRKKTTYQTYMQNILDVNYKGSFDAVSYTHLRAMTVQKMMHRRCTMIP